MDPQLIFFGKALAARAFPKLRHVVNRKIDEARSNFGAGFKISPQLRPANTGSLLKRKTPITCKQLPCDGDCDCGRSVGGGIDKKVKLATAVWYAIKSDVSYELVTVLQNDSIR